MTEQKKTTIGITGMTCAACANRIEKNLNKLDDVEANVNVTTEKLQYLTTQNQHPQMI